MKRLTRILIRSVLLSALSVVCAGFGLYWYQIGPKWVSTENAYIKTKMIAVSADVDGRVAKVMVSNNQFVSQGDLLFEIEREPFQMDLASSDAELAKVEQQFDRYKAAYRLGQLEINEAEEQVRFYTGEYERHKSLSLNGIGTKAQLDQALHDLEMAKAKVSVMRQKSAMALTELTGDPNLPSVEHPLYLKAKAMRDQAKRNLDRTAVFAPADGHVSNVSLEPGEYVQEGGPVFSLVSSNKPWLEANLKESQLTNVRVGQSATVEVDAYPDLEWQATISSISYATGAEFALLPPQNATGNWVKVVQRIPVLLEIARNPDTPPLRAGMTVSVSIDTEQERDMYDWLENLMSTATAMGRRAKGE